MSKGICIQFGVILMAGIFFATLWPFSLYADVIPAPYLGEDVGIALEFIASREKSIRNDFSYVTWGGLGWITSPTGEGGISYGFELALEGRAYRDGRQLKGAFVGVYVGSALIRIRSAFSYPNADYLGFTLGSKIGYKFVSSLAPLGWKKVRILSEPYLSLSITEFKSINGSKKEWTTGDLLPTLGIRIVLEWLKKGE